MWIDKKWNEFKRFNAKITFFFLVHQSIKNEKVWKKKSSLLLSWIKRWSFWLCAVFSTTENKQQTMDDDDDDSDETSKRNLCSIRLFIQQKF